MRSTLSFDVRSSIRAREWPGGVWLAQVMVQGRYVMASAASAPEAIARLERRLTTGVPA